MTPRRLSTTCLLVLLACSNPEQVAKVAALRQAEGEPFSWVEDPSLQQGLEDLPPDAFGPRPLAAVRDADGVTSRFIANQLLVSLDDPQQLGLVLQIAPGAIVVGDDHVPEPPPQLNLGLSQQDAMPTTVLVRVQADAFPFDGFVGDASALGAQGEARISSNEGVHLLALATRLQAMGVHAGPNFVLEPTGSRLLATEETSLPVGGFFDAFGLTPFQPTGSKASVTNAWQFVAAHDFVRRVRVAIIDSGYWLDGAGHPLLDAAGLSDLPFSPAQYDFTDDDYLAGGPNTMTCGGSPCPWHGNRCAGVALGTQNNRSGTSGSGGQVADPILLRVGPGWLHNLQVMRAVKTARLWGADVISMSFGGDCDWFCRTGDSAIGYEKPFNDARAAGVALVAAAGNGKSLVGYDAADQHFRPCELSAVLCIGALNDGATSRIGYSNYGSVVRLFAPTNIPTLPDGATGIAVGAQASHGGTSASTPLVAGVLAMMKSIDPSLSGDALVAMALSTASTDSSDPAVPAYLNAFKAVSLAATNRLPADGLEPNDVASSATALASGTTLSSLTLTTAGDVDLFRFTLTDYTRVDLTFDHVSGLGSLSFFLSKETAGGGPATGVVMTSPPNRRTYHADVMGPGTYLLKVAGSAPNLYDLRLDTVVVGLMPDMFEVDDTYATAATPGEGDFDVNHHVVTDLDYYAFDYVSSSTAGFRFDVTSSDWGETVRLYSPSGVLLSIDATAAIIAAGSPSGRYTVRVSGTTRGRYSFSAYSSPAPGLFPELTPIDPFPGWLRPGCPGLYALLDDRDRVFVFEADPSAGDLTLQSPDLHVSLLDVHGQMLVEGAGQQPGVETLSQAQLQPGGIYAVKVSPRSPPGQGSLSTLYRYSLRFGPN